MGIVNTRADRSDNQEFDELFLGEGRRKRRLSREQADTALTFLRANCDCYESKRGGITIKMRDGSRAPGDPVMISGSALSHYLASEYFGILEGPVLLLTERPNGPLVKNAFWEAEIRKYLPKQVLQAWLAPAVAAKLAAVLNK